MKNKKAISLIVLIITIIVMIILASAIIMSLDNTNIFNKAEEAVDKTNVAANKYLSEIKLAERELEKIEGARKVTDTNPGLLSGKGTTDEPYLIESIEDLVAFSNRVNGGESFAGKTIKLTRLLDFNSDNSYVNPKSGLKEQLTDKTGTGFIPIGLGDTEQQVFKGTFDGDGAEIRNLYINSPSAQFVGVFGWTEDATIRNLGVTGHIENNVYGAGGIVASALSSEKVTSITNCYSKVSINVSKGSTSSETGGIVGIIQGDLSGKTAIIEDCYNAGKITSVIGGYCAGIVGTGFDTYINKCYNLGTISVKDYLTMAGGIGAYVAECQIFNVYNEGSIICDNSTNSVGGIVGNPDAVLIHNAYNAGTIKADINYSGGICGWGNVEIKNAFNIAESGEYAIFNGSADALNTTNVYYIEGKQAYSGTGPKEGLIPLSLDVMKSQIFVETLNANIGDNTEWVRWVLGPNGYPTLDM